MNRVCPEEPSCCQPCDPCQQQYNACDQNFQNYTEGACQETCVEDLPFCDELEEEEKSKRNSGGMMVAIPIQTGPPPMELETEEDRKPAPCCICDGVTCLMLIAYIIAIVIFVLGIWYFIHDSNWNEIVRRNRKFPSIGGKESFISAKYLYLYEDHAQLQNARGYLLRDYRWLELIHLAFIGLFLVLTFGQFICYVTRGKEDHSRILILYYVAFGAFALFIALFPYLSWSQMETDYKLAAHHLQEFARRIWAGPQGEPLGVLNNGTAADAWTLSRIMLYCSTASENGLSSSTSKKLTLFKKSYSLEDMQEFGFCTLHKFKITNSMLTFLLAFVCLCIPCIYCLMTGELVRTKMMKNKRRSSMSEGQKPQGPPPGMIIVMPGDQEASMEMEQEYRRARQRTSMEEESSFSKEQPPSYPIKEFKEQTEGEEEMENQSGSGRRSRKDKSEERKHCVEELKKFKHFVEAAGSDGEDKGEPRPTKEKRTKSSGPDPNPESSSGRKSTPNRSSDRGSSPGHVRTSDPSAADPSKTGHRSRHKSRNRNRERGSRESK